MLNIFKKKEKEINFVEETKKKKNLSKTRVYVYAPMSETYRDIVNFEVVEERNQEDGVIRLISVNRKFKDWEIELPSENEFILRDTKEQALKDLLDIEALISENQNNKINKDGTKTKTENIYELTTQRDWIKKYLHQLDFSGGVYEHYGEDGTKKFDFMRVNSHFYPMKYYSNMNIITTPADPHLKNLILTYEQKRKKYENNKANTVLTFGIILLIIGVALIGVGGFWSYKSWKLAGDRVIANEQAKNICAESVNQEIKKISDLTSKQNNFFDNMIKKFDAPPANTSQTNTNSTAPIPLN